jgi:hypothetical protein
MSEHQKETAFLRRLIAFDHSKERHKLEEGIAQAQRDGQCVRRAAALMALFTVLGAVGVGYGAVLQENFPYGKSRFVLDILCGLGLASLICLLSFGALMLAYRRKLNSLRAEGRRLVITNIEARFGQPLVTASEAARLEFTGLKGTQPTPPAVGPADRSNSIWGEMVRGTGKASPENTSSPGGS